LLKLRAGVAHCGCSHGPSMSYSSSSAQCHLPSPSVALSAGCFVFVGQVFIPVEG
jgi:hypothetical protein